MTVAKPQSLSLIDTFSAGYRVINQRLWVILIPVILTLYLWLGIRLSFAPFLSNLRDAMQRAVASLTTNSHEQEQLVLAIQNADMRSRLALFNFVPILPPEVLLVNNFPQTSLYVHDLPSVLLAILVINLLALLLSSLFLALLAGAAQRETLHMRTVLWRCMTAARDICGYWLILIGVGLLLGLPFLALSVVLVMALPDTVMVVSLAWYVVLFWVYVYTGFAIEAILMSRVGPLRAIYNSVNIVRRNLLPTMALLLLSFVIVAGLNIVWLNLARTNWGLLLASVANAYIGSGLAATRLVFYNERLALWHSVS
ncbi:MAG: hypothetical protein MI924_25675 [Chloroflexales bacterium]|nr:hypothetical protein [Chloroflexales bacterium]